MGFKNFSQRRLLVLVPLLLLVIAASPPLSTAAESNRTSAQAIRRAVELQTLQRARKAFDSGDYQKAQAGFEMLSDLAKNSDIRRQALFGLASTRLVLADNKDEFNSAVAAWEKWADTVKSCRGMEDPFSTGRLDVFTRLVTEHGTAFDEVPEAYHGRLYLEVVPRSFPIKVRPDDSLAQARFTVGNPRLTDDDTRAVLDTQDIFVRPRMLAGGVQTEILRASDLRVGAGVFLSVDIVGMKGKATTIGYRARKHQGPIDLRDIGRIPKHHYWERIYSKQSLAVILEPDEFYIFASRELVCLPPTLCAEMVPYDAGSGELRTHYAGFFDSGFGYNPAACAGQTASAVVLEIRNRDVPFLIEQNQPLFRLCLLRNTEPPDRIYGVDAGSNYQYQRLRLSKQFARKDDEDEEEPRSEPDIEIDPNQPSLFDRL